MNTFLSIFAHWHDSLLLKMEPVHAHSHNPYQHHHHRRTVHRALFSPCYHFLFQLIFTHFHFYCRHCRIFTGFRIPFTHTLYYAAQERKRKKENMYALLSYNFPRRHIITQRIMSVFSLLLLLLLFSFMVNTAMFRPAFLSTLAQNNWWRSWYYIPILAFPPFFPDIYPCFPTTQFPTYPHFFIIQRKHVWFIWRWGRTIRSISTKQQPTTATIVPAITGLEQLKPNSPPLLHHYSYYYYYHYYYIGPIST